MSFLGQFRDPEPTPDPNPSTGRGTWEPTAYARAALNAEVQNVLGAPEGTRNDALNKAAFNLAQLITGGQISTELVVTELTAAGAKAGLLQRETANTIRSGLARGGGRARTAPERPLAAPQRPEQLEDGARSPWEHIDPAQAKLDQENPPAFLERADGTFLFYPGKVNGLIGESESGKTWVALLAVAQALAAGHAVLYLDFEDTYAGITGRLASMGAALDRFYYTAPDVGLTDGHRAALQNDLDAIHPALIILDGFNAAMTLLGLDLNSNTDATRFAQELLRPLSKTGAAVAYVDHLPKNREGQFKGGIGAQAKRAMTTGCAIRVDVEQEFGKGQTGRLKLTVDKDRPGLVRAIAAGGKHLGHAVLESNPLDGAVTLSIDPDGGSKPTILMARVTEYLGIVGQASKNQIRREVIGDNTAIERAITALTDEGKVTLTQGPRGAIMVTSLTSLHLAGSEVATSLPPLEGSEERGQTDHHTELRWDQR